MKLFLTSQASKVLDKIAGSLDNPPVAYSLLFIPTAGDPYGDNKPWLEEDRQKLYELGFKIEDYDLKGKKKNEVKKAVEKSDIIFVAGGNTFYLLDKMRASGFDQIIRELQGSDRVYIGSSAGSCIAGPNIEPIAAFDDPSRAQLESSKALELVDFVVLPHSGKEKYADIQAKVISEYGNKYKIIQITDEQMIVVENGNYEITK